MGVGVQQTQRAVADGSDANVGASEAPYPLAELHPAARPALRPDNEAFLQQAEHFGLSREKWESPLLAWAERLLPYGTTVDFLQALTVERVRLPNSNVRGEEAVAHQFSFDGRREEFERLLLEDKEARSREGVNLELFAPDYSTAHKVEQSSEAFSDRFNKCGCCQTVARALMLGSERSSSYVITVNAYPWDSLNEMQSALYHDSMANRVMRNNEGVYVPEVGKTIGSKLSATWIESVMRNADRKRAVAIQNHPASGMSAEEHLHAQFFPRDLYKAEILKQVINDFGPAQPNGVTAQRSRFHPFDTLVLSSSDTAALSRAVAEVYQNLEQAHYVSTLAYLDGYCFISIQSPRPNGYKRNDYGARVLLNYYRQEEIENWALVKETFFPPQAAPWEQFHPGVAA